MTSTPVPLLRKISPLVVPLLLVPAACLGPRADPSSFFVLSPAAVPAAGSAPLAVTLGLGPISLPGYLGRSEIAIRETEHRLAYAATDRWAEPLRDNLERVLARNLVRLLQPNHLAVHPWHASEGVEYGVAVDITRFEADGDGTTVTLEATWRVDRVRGGPGLRRSSLIREASGGVGTEASVAALSRALARLADDVAIAVRQVHEETEG